MTEEEFEAAKTTPANFTEWCELVFPDGSDHTGSSVNYISTENGYTLVYYEEILDGETKDGLCSFFRDGVYWGGIYDFSAKKWRVYSHDKDFYTPSTLISDLPYSFSEMTYDEEKREYYVENEYAKELLTEEQIAAGWGKIVLRFEDGKIVYIGFLLRNSVGFCYCRLTMGNVGTTVVPTPPESEIIFDEKQEEVPPEGGSSIPLPDLDPDARTTVTEEEFAAAAEGNFENYSMWAEMIYSNGEKFDGYAVDYVTYEDGKLVFYSEEMTEGKKSGHCAFFYDGKYWCGSYDAESGKWNVSSHSGYSIPYPAAGMPFALSDFTYNESTGEYRMLMEGVDQMMTPEQIAAGFGDLMLRFEDGKLVKMGRPMKIDETKGVQYYVLTLGNYGTTKVPTPPMEDVVFNDNNGSISPDYNGGNTNEDLPPPSSDKNEESNNNNNNNNNNNDEDKDAPATDNKAVTVWVSIEGREYHKDSGCSGGELETMTLKEAEYEGYRPCKLCN